MITQILSLSSEVSVSTADDCLSFMNLRSNISNERDKSNSNAVTEH